MRGLAAVYLEKRKTYLATPGKKLIDHSAAVKQVDGFYQESKVHQFTLACDEHKEPWGGTDRAPSPMQYLLSAVGFSINNQILIYSNVMGVKVNSLETTVTAAFDPKGCHNIRGHTPEVTSVLLTFKMTSDSSREKVQKVLETASKSCPVYQTLKKGTRMQKKLELNDGSI